MAMRGTRAARHLRMSIYAKGGAGIIFARVPHNGRCPTVAIAWSMGDAKATVHVDPPVSGLDRREILQDTKRAIGMQAMMDEHAGRAERAQAWREALRKMGQ